MHKRLSLLLPLLLVVFAAACAGGRVATPGPATPAPATPAAATPAAATPAAATPAPSGAAGGEIVKLATSDLGEIVVDGAGRTLYGFTPDEASGEPTCYDSCADNWPALTAATGFTVGAGLDQASFSIVSRTDDAGDQLAFGVYPLYYFAGDSAAGDVNGQGVGDNWFVVGADGELITE